MEGPQSHLSRHCRCNGRSMGRPYAAASGRAVVSEQRIQQEIRLACSTGDTRLFRNNTGTLRDQHGRPVQFGLAKGSADLIGWRTVTITPEMVGTQVAVFTSIEVKTPTGRLQPEQQQWMEAVQAAGGIAGVARSVEDACIVLSTVVS